MSLENKYKKPRSVLTNSLGLNVWRRVSDLATDLFALGLNREATYSSESIPFFLAECRRRTFVRAYYLDKIFATVFNRPPRISSRHADCKLPLDIPDDALFAISPEVLSEIKINLTHDGWNTNGIRSTATWARLRYILGEFREETAEYQIRSTPSIDSSKLRYIAVPLYYYHLYKPNSFQGSLRPMPSNLVQSSSTSNVRSKLLDLRFTPCSLLPTWESILVLSSHSFSDISNAWRVSYIYSPGVTRSVCKHAGNSHVDGELVESRQLPVLTTRSPWNCNISICSQYILKT